MTEREVAVVVGVGAGLGAALVRRFAQAGMAVAAVARSPASLAPLAEETGARTYSCDATIEAQVEALFAKIADELGPPALVVHNPSLFVMKPILDLEAAGVIGAWRVACLGGFLVGRAAARSMVERGQGTILFTGSTPSVKAMAEFSAFAAAKSGVRALAQSMARELGAKGVHVAHILVDGPIDGPGNEAVPAERKIKPADIAETFLQIHLQPRSAWTQEIDLRPAAAKF